MLEYLFSSATLLFVLFAGFQSAVPLIIGATGGAFSSQVNVFNLGLEGMMISGAFAGFAGAHISGSVGIGALSGVSAGLLVGGIFAVATVYYDADEIVVGFVLNLAMLALMPVLLTAMFDASGQLVSTRFGEFPKVGARGDVMMIVTVVIVAAAHWLIYHTKTGLRMRAVGGNPAAAEAAGVSPARYRVIALLIGGALNGLAGAYLPLSGLQMFTLTMTAGIGFIAVAAVLFGDGRPIPVALAAMLFGFMGAVVVPFQRLELPTEFSLILPYLVTALAVAVKGVQLHRGQSSRMTIA